MYLMLKIHVSSKRLKLTQKRYPATKEAIFVNQLRKAMESLEK